MVQVHFRGDSPMLVVNLELLESCLQMAIIRLVALQNLRFRN